MGKIFLFRALFLGALRVEFVRLIIICISANITLNVSTPLFLIGYRRDSGALVGYTPESVL